MARPANPVPSLKFEDDEIPTTESAPNPFDEPVAALAKEWDNDKDSSAKAKRVNVPEGDAIRLASKVSDAAVKIDKSARIRFTDDKGAPLKRSQIDSKDGKRTLTMRFWLRPAKKAGETDTDNDE